MDFRVDRELHMPLRLQLKGMIEYGIACGELPVGEVLPSVRELAEAAGVAPMTVSLVYRDLKKDGLIETRPGAGTYVADSSQARMAAQPSLAALHRQIDDLIDRALHLGVASSDIGAMFNARLTHRLRVGRRTSIVMVGLFPEATASYAKYIADRLGSGASVESVTIDEIRHDPAARLRAASTDLALTFANRHREVGMLLPSTKVVSVRFIPSEATRLALASLDPMARVVVVSRFPDFLPILRSGVQRFAAHVQDITAISDADPRLRDLLEAADVVVYSTGAERAEAAMPHARLAIEYRHNPDPSDIERLVAAFVAESAAASAPAQRKAS